MREEVKKVKNRKKGYLTLLLAGFCFLLAGCGHSRMERFSKPDIKDDFCGPVMNYQYCKCAFHDEFCEDVGLSPSTANSYVRSQYKKWVDHLVKNFGTKCKAAGGIYYPKYRCEYCEAPYAKQVDECIVPEEEEGGGEKEEELSEEGFKPEAPLASDCNTTDEFEDDWKKYSDIDNRIPVQSRSWEAQNIVRLHTEILDLKVENFKLERDMEIDRQLRLELREYKNALVQNIRQNLIKATIRLSYVTYSTIKAGSGAANSYGTFLNGTAPLARAGGLLSTVKTFVPKNSDLAIDTSTVTGKVANIGVETAYQAMEALGNPKDVAMKFITESRNAALPSADISPEEVAILRDQHLANKALDRALAESYRVNSERRQKLMENRAKIEALQAEIIGWEEREKIRVQDMLRNSCLDEKQEYEED